MPAPLQILLQTNLLLQPECVPLSPHTILCFRLLRLCLPAMFSSSRFIFRTHAPFFFFVFFSSSFPVTFTLSPTFLQSVYTHVGSLGVAVSIVSADPAPPPLSLEVRHTHPLCPWPQQLLPPSQEKSPRPDVPASPQSFQGPGFLGCGITASDSIPASPGIWLLDGSGNPCPGLPLDTSPAVALKTQKLG